MRHNYPKNKMDLEGTTDGIYSMKRIHQISNRKKQSLYLLFVDLTAAFDRISKEIAVQLD